MNWKIPVLLSYGYLMEESSYKVHNYINETGYEYLDIILDSGAFNSFKRGIEINMDDYCRYVKNPPFPISNYFMLDSIGDFKKTKRNYVDMVHRDLTPIPVFTRGAPIEDYHFYRSTADLVGIGGIAGTRKNKEYLKYLMTKIEPRDTHWLGFANQDFLIHYKPVSCDSSSIASGARYGTFKIYSNGQLKQYNRKTYQNEKVKRYMARLGLDYYQLKREESWRWEGPKHSLTQRITTVSYLKYIRALQERIGVTMYLAFATGGGTLTVYWAQGLINTYKEFKEVICPQ